MPYEAVRDAGKIGWVKYILNLVMDGVKNLSDGQMQFMFPKHNRKNGCELDTHYVRLQIPIRPEHEDMDNASPENIAQLERYGQELIQQSKEKIDFIIHVLNKRTQKKDFLTDKPHIDIQRAG